MKKNLFLLKNITRIILSNGSLFKDSFVLKHYFLRIKSNPFKKPVKK